MLCEIQVSVLRFAASGAVTDSVGRRYEGGFQQTSLERRPQGTFTQGGSLEAFNAAFTIMKKSLKNDHVGYFFVFFSSDVHKTVQWKRGLCSMISSVAQANKGEIVCVVCSRVLCLSER